MTIDNCRLVTGVCRCRATVFFLFLMGLVALITAPPAEAQSGNEAAHRQFVFAYRLLEQEEHKLAAQAFDKFLDDFPSDPKRGDATYYRAYLAHMFGKDQDAAKLLENAPATTMVRDSAVLLLKGDVYGRLGRHDLAIESLEKIHVDTLDSALKARVFYQRGQTYLALKKLDAAEGQLKQVVAVDSPWQAAGLLDLAKIRALLGRNDQAVAALKQCLDLGNTTVAPEAARLAGELAYQNKQYDEAIKFYQIVMTRYTSSAHFGPAVVGVLWCHLQAKQYGELLAMFEQHKDQGGLDVKDRVAMYYLAGSARQAMGEYDNAIELFDRIVTHASGSTVEDNLLYKLAACQFEVGRFDLMTQALAKLTRAHPDSPRIADAQFLSALAASQQNDQASGEAKLTAIINAGVDHPYYARALRQLGQLYDDSDLFDRAEKNYAAFLAFARGEGAGKIQDADVIAVSLRLIHLLYRAEQYERADAQAVALLARKELDPLSRAEAMYVRARALINAGKYEAARDLLKELLAAQAKSRFAAEAHYYLGGLLLTLGKPDEATSHLRQAAAADELPESLKITALRTVALQCRQQNQPAGAIQALRSLEELVGRERLSTDEFLWMARYYTDLAEPQKALKYLIPLISDIDSIPAAVAAEATLLSAIGLRDLGELENATEALREVVARGHGFGYRARLELARILIQMGRVDKALAEYEELLSADDVAVQADAVFDSARIYRRLATKRARESNDEGAAEARAEARNLFLRVKLLFSHAQFSPLPQLARVNLAEIDQEEGRDEQAIAGFEELVEKYPNEAYALYGKAMIKLQQKKKNEARSLLEELQDRELDRHLKKRVTAAFKAMETLR